MLKPVTARQVGRLGRIIDDLGATLLELILGVLGVGIREPAEVAGLLKRLGTAGAQALVVRAAMQLQLRLPRD